MKFDAVIFDMDGLLLDSERIALNTFVQACQCLNFRADISLYLRCVGVNAQKAKEILIESFGDRFPYDDISRIWRKKYETEAYKKPVPLKRGALALLKQIKVAGLPMGVATSTAHDKAALKLKKSGVLDFFKVIIGGDQIEHSKPDPEIYLKTAEQLGIPAARCLALEDSENGVKAAHAAGMTVIQIPDLIEPSDELKALGHTIVSSLEDIRDYIKAG